MDETFGTKEQDYISVRRYILQLKEQYPFLETKLIGRSVAGREITALCLGETEGAVLYAGAFHGTERITCRLLLTFLAALCQAVAKQESIAGIDARRALFGRGLIVVPLVNPDGCEVALKGAAGCGFMASRIRRLCNGDFAHWNANLRGVDINHNFDAGWERLRAREKEAGIYGPAPRRFGGFRPESEPETAALTELCRKTPMRHVVAFHAQGEVIYYNFADRTPPRAQKMAEILATTSNYALDVPTGLAQGGGFKDWFIESFGRPGFTVEIGKGENPLPPGDLPAIYERLKEMLMIGFIL